MLHPSLDNYFLNKLETISTCIYIHLMLIAPSMEVPLLCKVTTLWLKEEASPKAFFPSADNLEFLLTSDTGVYPPLPLLSMVPTAQQVRSLGPSSSNMESLSGHGTTFKPIFSAKSSQLVSVKIVRASVSTSAKWEARVP